MTKWSGVIQNAEGTQAGPFYIGKADVRTDEEAGAAEDDRRGWGLHLRARRRRLRAWG